VGQLVARGLLEDLGDKFIPIGAGLGCEKRVTVAGLALACERSEQVLFRLCTVDAWHVETPFSMLGGED
jgi:hypothetical protein